MSEIGGINILEGSIKKEEERDQEREKKFKNVKLTLYSWATAVEYLTCAQEKVQGVMQMKQHTAWRESSNSNIPSFCKTWLLEMSHLWS